MRDRGADASDPFAAGAKPRWRHLLTRRQRKYAPKRYAQVAGLIGPLVAFMVPAHHRLVVIVLVGALFFVPSVLVEGWFRKRERRRREQILP
jgi:hypothetical protein